MLNFIKKMNLFLNTLKVLTILLLISFILITLNFLFRCFYRLLSDYFIYIIKCFIRNFLFMYLFRLIYFFTLGFIFEQQILIIMYFIFSLVLYLYLLHASIKVMKCNFNRFWKNLKKKKI